MLVAVLIVACPCALALAAPFAFGTAQRWLARRGIFVRNAMVLEHLARVDAVVLDKTGTLTAASSDITAFEGEPLTAWERAAVACLAQASTHPLSRQIHAGLAATRTSGNTEPREAAAGTVNRNVADPLELVPPGRGRLTDFDEFAGGGLRGWWTAVCCAWVRWPGCALKAPRFPMIPANRAAAWGW